MVEHIWWSHQICGHNIKTVFKIHLFVDDFWYSEGWLTAYWHFEKPVILNNVVSFNNRTFVGEVLVSAFIYQKPGIFKIMQVHNIVQILFQTYLCAYCTLQYVQCIKTILQLTQMFTTCVAPNGKQAWTKNAPQLMPLWEM